MGIASFVIGLAVGFAVFITVAIAGVLAVNAGGELSETSPAAMIVGFVIIGLLFVTLIGLSLGIAGWLQKDRKKIFAILGTFINGGVIAGTIGLMALGLANS